MCQALNLNYYFLAKRNHTRLSVDHLYRSLNKNVTIAVEERGTNDILVPVSIATAYAWNSAPIDDTDIIRSIPAIGIVLHFPLDINFNTVPKMIENNAEAVLGYLNITNSYRHFSSSILKILIEDRQITHTERIDNSRNHVILHAGKIVITRTAM